MAWHGRVLRSGSGETGARGAAGVFPPRVVGEGVEDGALARGHAVSGAGLPGPGSASAPGGVIGPRPATGGLRACGGVGQTPG